MFTVNTNTQKIIEAEKILALGEPENLAKMDFVLVDAAGQPVNAENCQFDLMMGEVNCPRYKTDANTVSFRYIALELTKAQTDFTVTLKKDGAIICNDSIKVTAEVQGGGSSEVQGIVFENAHTKTTTVQIIPETFTADWTDFSKMFYGCTSLTSISTFNTSNGTDFSFMFYNCPKIITIPALDTSKGTDFSSMFYSCSKLTSIPTLNTSNGTNFINMFAYCRALTTIEGIDFSGATSSISKDIFTSCNALTSLTVNGTIAKNIDFTSAYNLDAASCISIAKALVENTSTLTITFNSTTYNNVLLQTVMPGTELNIKGYIVSKKGWAIKTA